MDGERRKEALEFVTKNARATKWSENGRKGRLELKCGAAKRRRKREREAGKLKGRGAATSRKRERAAIFHENLCSSIWVPGRRRGRIIKLPGKKFARSLRSSACITEWLHNSPALRDELYSISGKERGRSISAVGSAKNFRPIIHGIGRRYQTHLKKRTENIRENYAPERATVRATRGESPSHSRNLLPPAPGTPWICCWNFADSKCKGVDFRHLATRNGEREKEQEERRKSNYERAARSKGRRTGKSARREERAKKDRARGRARICQRRKPVRYGPSTRIERGIRNFPILKADTPSDDRWKRRKK